MKAKYVKDRWGRPRRIFAGGLLLLLVLIVSRNSIVRWLLPAVADRIVGVSLQIDRVHLGWRQIVLTGLRVHESTAFHHTDHSPSTWLSVDSVAADFSLFHGLRNGVWSDCVRIRGPRLTLRFDQEGKLLTQLPMVTSQEQPPSIGTIPIASLMIKQAEVTICQSGKEDVSIADVSVIGCFSDQVQLQLVAPKLSNGRLVAAICMDASMQRGSSHLVANEIMLDSRVLDRLSLVPLPAQLPRVLGVANLRMEGRHAGNLKVPSAHEFDLVAQVDSLSVSGFDSAPSYLHCQASLRDGILNTKTESDPSGSLLQFVGSVNLEPIVQHLVSSKPVPDKDASADGSWKLTLAPVSIRELASDLQVPISVDATVRSDAGGTIRFCEGRLRASAKGTIHLNRIQYEQVPVGSVQEEWSVALEVDPRDFRSLRGELVSDTQLSGVEFALLASHYGWAGIEGNAQGRVSVQVDLSRLQDPLRCAVASGRIDIGDVVLQREAVQDFSVELTLDDGIASILPTAICVRNQALSLEGSVDVARSRRGHVSFTSSPCPLAELSNLLSDYSDTQLELEGVAEMGGRLSFVIPELGGGVVDVDQLELQCGGAVTLSEVRVARTRFGDAELEWSVTRDGLRLESGSGNWLGGVYRLEATMSDLDWTHTVVVAEFDRVPVDRLVPLAGKQLPVSATGFLSGDLTVTSLSSLRDLCAVASVRTSNTFVQGVPIALTPARLNVQQGDVTLTVDGMFSGGRVRANAQGLITAIVDHLRDSSGDLTELPITGEARVAEIAIGPLASRLARLPDGRTPRGKLSILATRSESDIAQSRWGTVSTSLQGVSFQGVSAVNRIQCDTFLLKDHVRIGSLRGDLCRGTVSGEGRFGIANGLPTGRLQLNVENVDCETLGRLAGQRVDGKGNLRLTADVSGSARGTLEISADRIRASGVHVDAVRVPIRWTANPRSRTATWKCEHGLASVGGGQIRMATQGRYTGTIDVDNRIHLQRVDIGRALDRGGALGKVDGEIHFGSKRLRSLDDLSGGFDIRLSQPNPLAIPILDQLPGLNTISAARPGYGEAGGIVRGRLQRGVIHLDEGAVWRSNVQVIAEGKATLTGKLDVSVTASTESESPGDALIELFDSPVMLAAPAPVALLSRANDALRDRVVHAHVGGTAQRPVVRIQPGKQLSQEAIQFFLRGTLGTSAADLVQQRQPNLR